MVETRKLAAILAADVVGFSRMTRADEDGTLARLRALRRELIDPAVSANKGRVFKRTGDGVLVEFRSVVDAVSPTLHALGGALARGALPRVDNRDWFKQLDGCGTTPTSEVATRDARGSVLRRFPRHKGGHPS
jgi:adenylate cyclase